MAVRGCDVNTQGRVDFEAYVTARAPALRRFAYLLTLHAQDSEDLLQTVLASAAGRWSRVQRSNDVDAYLRRALVNRAMSLRRFRSRHPETLVRDHADRAATSPGLGTEDREILVRCLRRLPPRQRAVVVLRYYEELTETETAHILDCSVGTVKSQASKALASLRQAYIDADAG
jgi:RNA polymerase sigma-70 factor (sigma-E family)